jgi:elongation factor Tu
MDETERERLMTHPFRMVIQDVFNVKGRGVVATGRVEAGTLSDGDAVVIRGGDVPIPSTAIKVEMFAQPLGTAWPNDNIGIVLQSVEINYIKPGMIVTKQDEQ